MFDFARCDMDSTSPRAPLSLTPSFFRRSRPVSPNPMRAVNIPPREESPPPPYLTPPETFDYSINLPDSLAENLLGPSNYKNYISSVSHRIKDE